MLLVVACKENSLEVDDNKTEYIVIRKDQNAGRSNNIKIYKYISFVMAECFKYRGKILTNRIYVQERN